MLCIRLSGKGKTMGTAERSDISRSKWEGKGEQRTEHIEVSETVLSTAMYQPNPTECTTLSVNPKISYRLWSTMMCQCGVNCSKCTTLVRNSGE